jgi:hypothetical protein
MADMLSISQNSEKYGDALMQILIFIILKAMACGLDANLE